jgi:hypothetical protein
MDAISVVEREHRRIEKLLTADTLDEAAEEITIHAAVEDFFLYPALRVRQTQARLPESYDQHLEIKDRLVDALRAREDEKLLFALRDAVVRHFRAEESEILPLLRALMTDEELETLGQEVEAETRAFFQRRESRRHPQPY